MARSIHNISIPSSTRYLEDVRRFVETHTIQAGFSTKSVEQIKLAVDEACTNVIKHAYRGNESFEIKIKLIIDSDRCTVCISDKGEAFRPKEYLEPDIYKLVKRRQSGGLGVHIMRRMMDQVEYSSNGNVNEVRLTKYLPSHVNNGSSTS